MTWVAHMQQMHVDNIFQREHREPHGVGNRRLGMEVRADGDHDVAQGVIAGLLGNESGSVARHDECHRAPVGRSGFRHRRADPGSESPAASGGYHDHVDLLLVQNLANRLVGVARPLQHFGGVELQLLKHRALGRAALEIAPSLQQAARSGNPGPLVRRACPFAHLEQREVAARVHGEREGVGERVHALGRKVRHAKNGVYERLGNIAGYCRRSGHGIYVSVVYRMKHCLREPGGSAWPVRTLVFRHGGNPCATPDSRGLRPDIGIQIEMGLSGHNHPDLFPQRKRVVRLFLRL